MKRALQKSEASSSEKHHKKSKKYPSEKKLKEITSICLSDRKNSNILVDLIDQFECPSKVPASCVHALENIFSEILSKREMAGTEVKPSQTSKSEVESQYKHWLRECYEDSWDKMKLCLQKGSLESSLQALNSMFNLIMKEACFPLLQENTPCSFPTHRLKMILQSLALSKRLNMEITKRFSEFAQYKDVFTNTWLALEELLNEISKSQPSDKSIMNILLVLSLFPKPKKLSEIVLCSVENVVPDERRFRSSVTKVWKQLSRWRYSSPTHQLLLVVLIEQIMPQMNSPIFLTDYFMDALNREESEIQMLALQGIFNLVIKFNIEYPNIYGKLYQLYREDMFTAKYKVRLYALTDDFLRSTHLPLALVAAFAKRFSRLLLTASPPDQLVLLTLVANLLIRHPGLVFLCHKPDGKPVTDDPYKEKEPEPLKSDASLSQLWEVRLMQNHYSERVAKLGTFINREMPSVEFELPLDLTWSQMLKKDMKTLKKKIPQIAENLKPLSVKVEEGRRKEMKLSITDFDKLFISELVK